MYFDRDCDGAADIKEARWIIDTDAPNQTRYADLDGDRHCKYLARADAYDGRIPPASAKWEMDCGDGKWLKRDMTLESVTGRNISTTTGTTGLGPRKTVITGSAFEVNGACGLQSNINEAFVHEGETKSGAPYYRSSDGRHYVYFDPDCSGDGQNTNRWIIDLNAPNPALDADLDEDEACQYIARTSGNKKGPPMAATWVMYCDDGWREVSLSLVEVAATNVTVGTGGGGGAISGEPVMAPGALIFFALVPLWALLAPLRLVD